MQEQKAKDNMDTELGDLLFGETVTKPINYKTEQIGVPRTHPDFKKSRRERFCKLLRDAYKTLSKDLAEQERAKVKELYQLIEAGNV